MHFPPLLWPRISELFDEASGLAPVQRTAWLARLERREPACVASVRRLLAAAESTPARDPLRLPLDALRASAVAAAVHAHSLEAGNMIGPYRLVESLGRGGMAAVWLADQTAGVPRRVALKLPHIGLEGGLRASERFVQERDFLAALEHPHIARLYDAGVSAEGVSYLAMEFVAGMPITGYCDAQRMGLARRVDLFQQVLAAVAHAHTRLVIHGDLKAGNILVTPAGEVKLLDFGIARLLGEPAAAAAEMGAEARVFTPDTAPPEQLQGLALSTESDVYSLGVVLYELLSGRRPYRLDPGAADLAAQWRAITPAAPSAAAGGEHDAAAAAARGCSARELRRSVAGDLDAIVAKAMQASAAARYRSVEALGQDLLRWRQGLPVLARPDTLAYRAGKFLRRYRIESAAALLATALLGTATVTALSQARQSRVEAAKAQAVKGFMLDLLNRADPGVVNGRAPQGVRVYELLDEAGRSVADAFSDQPDIKAELLLTLGQAYETLGLYDKSVDTLRSALSLPLGPGRAADALRPKLLVQLASALAQGSRLDEALAALDQADALFQRLGDSASVVYAHALELRGSVHFRRGLDAPLQSQARALLERSVALYRSGQADSRRLGSALRHLSEVYSSEGEHALSLQTADELVALAGGATTGRGLQSALAHHQRGEARWAAGAWRGAADDHAEAARLYVAVLGPEHVLSLRNQRELGVALAYTGQAGRGLALLQGLGENRLSNGNNPRFEAITNQWLGVVLADLGELQAAQRALQLAREQFAGLSGTMRSADLRRSEVTLALAGIRRQQGRHDEAQALLSQALAVRKTEQHRERFPLAEVHLQLAMLALQRQQPERAREQIDAALQQAAPQFSKGLKTRARAQAALAEWALQAGLGEAALAASADAMHTAALPALREDGWVEAAALSMRGRVLCQYGDKAAGSSLLLRAAQRQAALVSPQDLQLAGYRLALARCLAAEGRDAEARAALRAAALAVAAHSEVDAGLRQAVVGAASP
jgi:serine/threonine-protein kinase